MKHLIFYDETCGFCLRCIRKISIWDKKHLFFFSPLHGELAKTLFLDQAELPDYLVLVENFESEEMKFTGKGQAVFRICQILGGIHMIPGLLGYLPESWQNYWYRYVTKLRHSIKCCKNITKDERFLP
ncbi:MAG: hypothetical protein SP1CHLAM54_02010 [Chlamydiia bacterium]|nr:hypothetical protein [Chlamydiia bacterium]MCH9615119.1 hypothetical protein [Chlamydiia bacterium]MCH9628559.1 hypothetical protein [Chlamydiia bacterium]